MKIRLLIIFFFIYSCSDSNSNKDSGNIHISTVQKDTITDTQHFSIAPSKVFEQYALNYKPMQTVNSANIALPQINDTLKFAIDSLFKIDTSNLRRWTALILIKQFFHHLECCHQSYELRNGYDENGKLDKATNPVLFAFLNLTNQMEIGSSKNEFLSSGFIYDYLVVHTELANNKYIKPYFDRVNKIERNAEKRTQKEKR